MTEHELLMLSTLQQWRKQILADGPRSGVQPEQERALAWAISKLLKCKK